MRGEYTYVECDTYSERLHARERQRGELSNLARSARDRERERRGVVAEVVGEGGGGGGDIAGREVVAAVCACVCMCAIRVCGERARAR